MTDRLLSEAQAAQVLACSPRTVRRLAQLGFLTRVPVLGATRYRRSEVAAIVANGTSERAGVGA